MTSILIFKPISSDTDMNLFQSDLSLRVVSGSSTPDSSTPDSSTIYTLQLLIASHKQFRGFWGAEPPVLAFSLGVLGLVSQEYDVLVFGV